MDEISPKELETLILLFINESFNQIINSYLKYFDEKCLQYFGEAF